MINLTFEEIAKYSKEYFEEMLKIDNEYFKHCSDSWIYDAEEWFYDQFNEYLDSEIVKDFKDTCRVIWQRMYDERYSYEEYSRVMVGSDIFQKILDLQHICCPAKKILCSEVYAKHLTKEQRIKREKIFECINSSLVQILKGLNELSDEIKSEKE